MKQKNFPVTCFGSIGETTRINDIDHVTMQWMKFHGVGKNVTFWSNARLSRDPDNPTTYGTTQTPRRTSDTRSVAYKEQRIFIAAGFSRGWKETAARNGGWQEEKPRESYEPMKMTMPRGHTSDVFHRFSPPYLPFSHLLLLFAILRFSLKASFVIIGRERVRETERTREGEKKDDRPPRFIQYPEYW